MTAQVQTVNQAAIHKLATEIAVQTKGKENLTEFKKAAKDVLVCCEQLQKQAKEHRAAEEKSGKSVSAPTPPSSDPIPSVSTAELRKALAKLVEAYIKSTGETGKVLFGSGSKNTGIVGAEMTMGFSSANEAKNAMESQATGMIVSGCFSIAAGCMAVGGGAMGAGATGEAASSLTELNAAPQAAEAAEPTTAASGEASSTGSDTVTVADEIEMTPVNDSAEPDSADPSTRRESIEARLEERPNTDPDSTTNTDTTNERVEGRVEQSEKSYTKEQKEQEREQIRLKKEGKQSKAQALTMGTGLAQGSGSITQSHFTQQQATQDQASKTLQAAAQAVNTSTQTAQKFYGDIQSGVQAVAQSMDLVNQTVVASSRI